MSPKNSPRKNKKTIAASAILLVCLFPAKSAYPRLLGDAIKPFARIRGLYDSNVFRVRDRDQLKALTGDDRLSDFITVYSVGTTLRYGLPGYQSADQSADQSVSLLLRTDSYRYGHYTGLNEDQEELQGDIAMRFLDRVSLRIEGGHSKLLEPRRDYQSALPSMIALNTAGIIIGYDLPSGLGAGAAFRRERLLYSIFADRDETTRDYSGALSYAPSPYSRFEISYERMSAGYDYPQPAFSSGGTGLGSGLIKSDNSGDAVKALVHKIFSPKTDLTLSAGYLRRSYQFGIRSFGGLIWSAGLDFRATGKLRLFALAARQLHDEVFENQFYSVNDSFAAGAGYRMTGKIKASLSGTVLNRSFRGAAATGTPERRDTICLLKESIGWRPEKGLSFDLSCRYEVRHSNSEGFDFRDNEVGLTAGYEF